MLQQMLHVIRGMKDINKLGRLQGAVLSRICEISGTDPVEHLDLLKRQVQESLTRRPTPSLSVFSAISNRTQGSRRTGTPLGWIAPRPSSPSVTPIGGPAGRSRPSGPKSDEVPDRD